MAAFSKVEKVLITSYFNQRRNYIRRKNQICSLIVENREKRKQKQKVILILEELLATLNAMHTVLCSTPTRKRSCHRFIRNYGWWEIIKSTYSDDRFKQAFRVGKETFYFILSKIESKIVKKNLVEEPISAEMRLAVCLFRLGRGDYHYNPSHNFFSYLLTAIPSVCRQ